MRHPFLTVAMALLAASCASPAATSNTDGPRASPAIVVTESALLPTTVDALPPIDVPGFETLLTQLRGTPVVVNFWAAWCEPCRSEMPRLSAAAREHRDTVQFVGVDILDNRGDAERFIDEFQIPFPSVFDATGATRTSVGSFGQPVTIFIEPGGDIVAKVDGEVSQEQLARQLDRIDG